MWNQIWHPINPLQISGICVLPQDGQSPSPSPHLCFSWVFSDAFPVCSQVTVRIRHLISHPALWWVWTFSSLCLPSTAHSVQLPSHHSFLLLLSSTNNYWVFVLESYYWTSIMWKPCSKPWRYSKVQEEVFHTTQNSLERPNYERLCQSLYVLLGCREGFQSIDHLTNHRLYIVQCVISPTEHFPIVFQQQKWIPSFVVSHCVSVFSQSVYCALMSLLDDDKFSACGFTVNSD